MSKSIRFNAFQMNAASHQSPLVDVLGVYDVHAGSVDAAL